MKNMTCSLRMLVLLPAIAIILYSTSAQGDCLNAVQFPSAPITTPAPGQTQTISTCSFFQEYAHVTGAMAGGVYEFAISGNGYITIRAGSFNGLVIAQGYSPVQVWAGSSDDLFPHYNTDAFCGILDVCQTSTVAMLGMGTELVSGRLFLDTDLDCSWSTGDLAVPQTVVMVEPGPLYATTNADGLFYVALDAGNYTATQMSPYVVDHCQPTPQAFTDTAGTPLELSFADTAVQSLDMMAMLTCGLARPGFDHVQSMVVRNLSAVPSGVVQMVLVHDEVLDYEDAVPAPTTVAGNTITWDLAPFAPFEQRELLVTLQVPTDPALVGTEIGSSCAVYGGPMDLIHPNDMAHCTRTVTASFDPNDKTARSSTGISDVLYYIDQDIWIDYTIRFQNTGTDTAFTVIITDTLPPTLDPGSIVWGAASHAHTRVLEGQGVLKFTFPNILLPDSNVNEPLSHGFVGFRIRPHLPILPGTAIENIANIYFDFNPPVITEPSVLVAEFSTGLNAGTSDRILRIFPNPARDHITITADADISAIAVFSADGREVLRQRAGASSIMIDVSALSAGSYMLSVNWWEGGVARERIIIQ